MTLNWGHKLILVFVVFAGLMSFLVFQCMHTNYELVSKEYYKDELTYQQVIDGTAKAKQLSSPVSITQSDGDLILQLPEEMKQQTVTGSLWLYCVTDSGKDKKIPLKPSEGIQLINGSHLQKGNYVAKLTWQANGVEYYSEQSIAIH
ncbi:MAG: FixH family protein [Chitinophagaceae bacterium]